MAPMISGFPVRFMLLLMFFTSTIAGYVNDFDIIDLAHSLGSQTVTYSINPRFNLTVLIKGPYRQAPWILYNSFASQEHASTHLDAPLHLDPSGKDVAGITLDRLTGPGVIIDVTSQARKNADYRVSIKDILAWEYAYGPIPKGAIVFMRCGWAERYKTGNRTLIFGTENPSILSEVHFPAWSLAATEFLVKRRYIKVLGVDTPTIEGPTTTFILHRFLAENDIPAVEFLNNLELVHPYGSTIITAPIKLVGGSGAPARVLALLWK